MPIVAAEPSSTTAAASSPANAAAPPPGFVQVDFGRRIAFCQPQDRDWVLDCLKAAPPGTQPATQPADLLSALHEKQPALIAQLQATLPQGEADQPKSFVQQKLTPLMDRLTSLRARVVYVVTTKEELKRAVMAGWGGNQFHYNRISGQILFNGMLDVSPDGSDGDSIVPAPYLPDDSTATRSEHLRKDIGRTEAGVGEMIGRESQSAVQLAFAEFITAQVTAPLHLKLEQEWFSAGVVGVLSSEDLAMLTGAKSSDIIHVIARPNPRNPVSIESIDLLHPIAPDQLRPEIAGAYADAFRRRSIGVVSAWIDQSGADAISKTLAAIRATPPADGPALLALIQKTTGVDLTSQLAAP